MVAVVIMSVNVAICGITCALQVVHVHMEALMSNALHCIILNEIVTVLVIVLVLVLVDMMLFLL